MISVWSGGIILEGSQRPLVAIYGNIGAILSTATQRGNIDYDQIGVDARLGNGTKIQMAGPGSKNDGHVLVYDGSLNAVDGGPLPSSFSFSDEEIPTGTINGSNVTFTLAHTPSPGASLQLFLAGLMQWQNASGDYTLSGSTITFLAAPTTGPLLAFYRF